MPATMSFQDVSAQLAKAVDDVAAKKKTMESAILAVNKASDDYNKAVADAKSLRDEMQNILSSVFGDQPKERIR